MTHNLTAVISRDEDMFVAVCPELDVASQGYTQEEARANLQEAVEGFLEVASPEEITRRLQEGAAVLPLAVESEALAA